MSLVSTSGPVPSATSDPDADRMAREFGCRRGWCLHHYWRTLAWTGMLRRWRHIDWSRVRRLVFVCQGNICRSAYAERRAVAMGCPAISCGLKVHATGAPAAAVSAATARGLDLARHRPTALDDVPLALGDLLIAMTPPQARALDEISQAVGVQVTVLGMWSTPTRIYLQDPYGLSDAYFSRCYALIDTGVAALTARLETHHATHVRV